MKQSWITRFRKSPPHTQTNIVCTAIIMLATVAYAIIAGVQLTIMRGTLKEMKRSGEQSTEQMWSAIGNINWEARSMDWSQKVALRSMESSEIQSQNALQASIDNARLDQRPWLSLKEITCSVCNSVIGGPASGKGIDYDIKHLRASINVSNLKAEIVNTGKTPAEDIKVDFTVHYGGMSHISPGCEKNPRDTKACFPSQFETHNFSGYPSLPNSVFHVAPTNMGAIAPNQATPIVFEQGNSTHIFPLPSSLFAPSVYVEGTITYRSVWGGNGETKFCFFPALTYIDPANKKPENYDYCDAPGSNTMR